MPPSRIRHVRLIDSQDKAYQQFCNDRKAEHQRLREKQAPSASNQLSLLIEQSVLHWLKTEIPLIQERILSFQCQDGLYGYRQKYREVDAISGTINQPEYFFEIKASANPRRVIPLAQAQLQESLSIAAYRWSSIRPCLIYVDTAPSGMLPDAEYQLSSVHSCSNIADLLNYSGDRLPCIQLSGVEVWQQALEANLIAEYSLWERAQAELKQNILERQERARVKAMGVADTASTSRELAVHVSKAPHVFCSPAIQGETVLGAALRQAIQRSSSVG